MDTQFNNVSEFLLRDRDPGAVALCTLAREHSYAELKVATAAVAQYLLTLPLRKGDRALIAGANSPFWVAAYLGSLRAGLVCVPVPAGASPKDVEYILQVTDAKVAIVEARFAIRCESLLRGCHLITEHQLSPLSDVPSQASFSEISVDAVLNGPPIGGGHDLAALMFTSGSTGRPRGVMVSHANIIANTESIIQYLGLTSADRMMTVLPFHYCFGTSLLHTHLRVGGSLVLEHRFLYPEVVLRRMAATCCTGFAGVPSHFQILLRRSDLRERSFPHLRYVQQAGGHLAPALVRELRRALPRTAIFTMYGQTEATARLSYLPPDLLDEKPGSIGKGIPGVTLCVCNELGQQVKPGEVGEIVAQGENIANGYWRGPGESEMCFREGRLYTGDQATVDEDGFIYIVGRSRDFLKCGGKRVSCRSIEDLVLEFEDVVEAAVVGMPDEILTEAVKLFVVPRNPDCRELQAQLRLFCKNRMPPEFVPKEVVVVTSLPKNSAGKVLKEVLKQSLVPSPQTPLPPSAPSAKREAPWVSREPSPVSTRES